MKPTYDACVGVISDLPFDARVWKEVRSLSAAGYSVKLTGCRYDIEAVKRRSEGGVDVVEFPFGWRDRPKSSRTRLGAVARVWREIVMTRARLYHAHNVHTIIPALVASRLRSAKLVYDAHELYGVADSDGIRGRILAAVSYLFERLAVRSADVVFTTNQSRAEILERRHGRADIDLLANVPPLHAHVEPIDPGFPDAPVILYQGWIAPDTRAFRETVRALRLLPHCHFVILGFGFEARREKIRRWAVEEGVGDRVHFLPPRPFDELVRTAAAATVGLVPIKPLNLNQVTGDTNKLHEYLMAGLPVVASDLPEIARVVRTGNPAVGETFNPLSPESIAAAVSRVIDDPAEYALRRSEARRVAVEQFNWGIEEHHLLNRYRSLLGSATPSRAKEATA